MSVFWTLVGVLLVGCVLLDVWLTILHPDAEGRIAATVRRAVWRASSFAGRRRTPYRTPLVLAGPILVTGTFLAWTVPLVLGVALIVWPHLDGFLVIGHDRPLTFVDALYFAGGTLTVLGLGDVIPVSTPMKILSVLAAGIGFAMFTALVAYLIELISGLMVRSRLALAVRDQTREHDGAGLMLRSLTEEGVAESRQRCRLWADSLREVADTVRRYPLVALTHRPRQPDYDLEPALEQLAEATVMALLAAGIPSWHGLRLRAEELAHALLRTQDTIAGTYLGEVLHDGHEREARDTLRHLWSRLVRALDGEYEPDPVAEGLAYEVLLHSIGFLYALRGWAAPGIELRDRRTASPTAAQG